MPFSQSILKEISPGISLEGKMLKLKLQYFGHLMRRVDSLEKTLMLYKWKVTFKNCIQTLKIFLINKREAGDENGETVMKK